MIGLIVLLCTQDAELSRARIWQAYREKHQAEKSDFQAHSVKVAGTTMPFTIEKRGRKPADGWPVFICMHGGGGCPKEVNDSQWRIMQSYYRVDNCIYIAPRAPTDEWNGFYADYVYPLIAELLRMLNLFEEVNPNRVYLLGYSHGGYGAFAIGPKMPDRFAAIHASASAPTEGETAAENLMNTRFTFMIGEHDLAYGRLDRCRAFDKLLQDLRKTDKNLYPAEMQIQAGRQHSNLDDHDKPREMLAYKRDPVPKRLRWKLTDKVITTFYWLRVPEPGKDKQVDATVRDNRVELTLKNVRELYVLLDGRLVDMSKPVTILANGKTKFEGMLKPSPATLSRTLEERGDPEFMFDSEVRIAIDE